MAFIVKDKDGSVIFFLFRLVRPWLGFCNMVLLGSPRAASVAEGASWRPATSGLKTEFER